MSLLTDIRDQMLLQMGEAVADIDAALLARILNEINATGQHLATTGPAEWWHEGPAGDRLKAPSTISVGTTADSKTVTGSFSTYMHGCTVYVEGGWNRLFQTAVSTWQLLIPAISTATVSMTVYHDCLNLTDTSIEVFDVILEGYGPLHAVNNMAQLERPLWPAVTVTAHPPGLPMLPRLGTERTVSVPHDYAVDGTQLYGGSYVTQLRVNPLPNTTYAIKWTQKEKFSKFANWSDTRTTVIPHEYTESVFIPLAIERILDHPGFEGDKAEWMRKIGTAREIMAGLSKTQPKPVRISLVSPW